MINKRPCILCGTECESQQDEGFEVRWFQCPRCGTFGISRTLSFNLNSDEGIRRKAAILAAERYIHLGTPFVLTVNSSGVRDEVLWIKFEEFMTRFPRSAYEMIERSLLNLAAKVSHPSEKIIVTENDYLLFFSFDASGMLYIIRQMKEMDWVLFPTMIPGELTIETKGWQKVAELTKNREKSSSQAFVAMWFDDSTEEVFETGIRPAVEKSGIIKCIRIDQMEHNNKICDQIVAEIKRSRYLIADFSGNRGGVYFEAGLAQGLGLQVIWLVKQDDLKNVHFDTRQYNHIVYESPEDLYEKLSNRIAATIAEH